MQTQRKWLDRIKNSECPQELTLQNLQNPSFGGFGGSIPAPAQKIDDLLNELRDLNARWWWGAHLEKFGVFDTPTKVEAAVRRFRVISTRAAEIWEQLQVEAPHLLEGLPFLEEPTP